MFQIRFSECVNTPDIIGWNTSGVVSMAGMFAANIGFNQDIGDWDVSAVISFTSM